MATQSKLYLKAEPTLKDIQQYVRDLVKERDFEKYNAVQECLLLGEEVGELFKVIRKREAGMHIDANKTYELHADEELADILIMVAALANRLHVDLEQAFRSKEEKNKLRTWTHQDIAVKASPLADKGGV